MGQQKVLKAFPKEEDICYKELFERLYPNVKFSYNAKEYMLLSTMVNRLIKNRYVKYSRSIGRIAYYKLRRI